MVFVCKHIKKVGIKGITLVFFILVSTKEQKNDPVLINHEKIHLRQQWEMLILPFFFIYFGEYFFWRIRGEKHWDAYRKISFEKEAKNNEKNFNYLSERKLWGWIKYLKK